MKIALLGNPITTTSSGKFLKKFCQMVGPTCETLYIINDGVIDEDTPNIVAVCATGNVGNARNFRYPAISSLLGHAAAQLGLSIGLLRCIRSVQCVVVFPIVLFTPVLLAKLLRKKIILYEAQDILASKPTNDTFWKRLEWLVQLLGRNIVLRLTDVIIVEGKCVIS